MKKAFSHLVPLFVQTFLWIPVRLGLEWFSSLKIEGKENLNGIQTNVIFAMNHTSEIDPFIIPASLPMFSRFLPLFFGTEKKNFYFAGYSIITASGDHRVALKNHMRLADAKESFVMYLPHHGGVAFLADYAQCPIIPVAVSGISDMNMQDFFDRKRRIGVKFGKPIFQNELKGVISENHSVGEDIYKKQAQYVMKKLDEMMGS